MSRRVLSESEVSERLKQLRDWKVENGKLCRAFTFSDFVEAFAFMTELAMVSERLNHHPEWSNVYNTLTIRLSTHDVNGISEKDFEWAKECSQRFNQTM